MRFLPFILILLCLLACKKQKITATGCDTGAATTRVIADKKATVKMTATMVYPVYLVEDGTIDVKLVPCNIPLQFQQNDLVVKISGEVKTTVAPANAPCCIENFVISKISL